MCLRHVERIEDIVWHVGFERRQGGFEEFLFVVEFLKFDKYLLLQRVREAHLSRPRLGHIFSIVDNVLLLLLPPHLAVVNLQAEGLIVGQLSCIDFSCSDFDPFVFVVEVRVTVLGDVLHVGVEIGNEFISASCFLVASDHLV